MTLAPSQWGKLKALPWALPLTISFGTGIAWMLVGPLWLVATLSSVVLLTLALSSYTWALSLVLVGRTCLDLFWEQNVLIEGVRISPASIFSLITLFLLVLTMLVAREKLAGSDGIRALGVLLLGSAVGTVVAYTHFGEDANMAFREMVRLLVLVCWYVYLYRHSRNTGQSKAFVRAVFIAAVVPLAFGIKDVITGSGITNAGITRISSSFVDPNAFGFYLVFLTIFCFGRIAQGGDYRPWLVLLVSLCLLVFTYSRSAWISIVIAAPLFWLRVSRRRVIVVVILLALITTAYPIVRERLLSVDYADIVRESQSEVTSNSYTFRVLIWKRLLELWTEHPWLGWGLESTPLINPILSERDGRGAAAHNDAVRYLVETGIAGFLPYLIFLWLLGRRAYERFKSLKGEPMEFDALAALAIYVAFIVQSLTVAEPLHQSIFIFHFLGMMAVIEGLCDSRKVQRSLSGVGEQEAGAHA
jgi:O-antigen ligase